MKKAVAFTLALVMFLAAIAAVSAIKCSITKECSQNEIFRISSLKNGHAQLPGQNNSYEHIVCCDNPAGNVPLLRLSSKSNAQVQSPDQNKYKHLVGIDNAECKIISSGTCESAEYETCLVSLSKKTNAQVGDCSAYSNKVCCKPVDKCGNGIFEYPEQCDDGNRNNGDGCSSKCASEKAGGYFEEVAVTNNSDGTYTYKFAKDEVNIIEVESNKGLIDLSNFTFDYQESSKSGKVSVSIGGLLLTETTKSITLPMKQKFCAIDEENFVSGDALEEWDCWNKAGRITWSIRGNNSCEGAASPMEAKDQNENILPGYTCEQVMVGGEPYAKLSGFFYTTAAAYPEDEDKDGVVDSLDKCPNTVLPEKVPLTDELRPNHFAELDDDSVFEVNLGNENKSLIIDSSFSFVDTHGCTCEQILYCKPGENDREKKWGCTFNTMAVWVNQTGWSPDCQVDGIVAVEGESRGLFEDTDNGGFPDILDGDNDNDEIPDSEDSEPESAPTETGQQGSGMPDWWCDKYPDKC